MALHCPEPLAPFVRFLEGFSPASLEHLGDVYSPGAAFRDPLHEVRGLAALRQVHRHTLHQLQEVAIEVLDAHGDDLSGFVRWRMRFLVRGRAEKVDGCSHLRFAADGRVLDHEDFWDASFPVYGGFPLVGWALRGIRKLVTARTGAAGPQA